MHFREFVIVVRGSVLANYVTKCLDLLITLILGNQLRSGIAVNYAGSPRRLV